MRKPIVRWIAIALVTALVLTLADRTPLVRQIDEALRDVPAMFLPVALFLTLVGFALFVGVLLYSRARYGGPAARPLRRARSIREARRALLDGAWRRDSSWAEFLLATAGGVMLYFGLFGMIFVVGPPVVRLMAGMVIVYGVVRLTWALARA
jgi:hypothetical protein